MPHTHMDMDTHMDTDLHTHMHALGASERPALPQHGIGPFTFEHGRTVSDAAFEYALTQPQGRSAGLVIVCPSLTGTPDILQDWWNDVGPAQAREHCTTLYAHGFAATTIATLDREYPPTIRDIARGILALVRALGLPHPVFVTGGSLGGMIALETGLEAGAPTHALVLAAPAVQTAWSAGWNMIQLQALQAADTPQGFALARAVGMMTYRTEREFEMRFGMDAPDRNGRTMAGYLAHHGRKLIARFDPLEYERRVRAMDSHDVGRGRGGWRAAMTPHADRLSAVGVVGDALYSADIIEEWTGAVGAAYTAVRSVHGHDAFLLEREQMRQVIGAAFARAIGPGVSRT